MLENNFGDDLTKAISQYSGVLNLNYVERIYTEYPRLLASYLSGKTLISQKLTGVPQAGVNYGALGTNYTSEELEAIFR